MEKIFVKLHVCVCVCVSLCYYNNDNNYYIIIAAAVKSTLSEKHDCECEQ